MGTAQDLGENRCSSGHILRILEGKNPSASDSAEGVEMGIMEDKDGQTEGKGI